MEQISVINNICNYIFKNVGHKMVTMSISASIMDDIINWIEENIDKPLQIKDVANHAGYSVWHFQRMFSRHYGVSLGRYIRDRRLEMAAQTLLTTDDFVYEVCFKYGFDSQQTFTRTFSKKYHYPPALYRKIFKKTEGDEKF